jgi:hypothetical protein
VRACVRPIVCVCVCVCVCVRACSMHSRPTPAADGPRLGPRGLTLQCIHDILGVVPQDRVALLLEACRADTYQEV